MAQSNYTGSWGKTRVEVVELEENIKEPEKKKSKIEKINNWIERKDLVYWLIIVVLLWLLSSDYGKENPVVLDNWNFTGTIVSIILAILAIVYTYAQNSTTLLTTNKLGESADKIEDVTKKIEDISMDALFLKLENKVNEIVGVIDSSLKEEMGKQNDFLKEFIGSTSIVSPFSEAFDIMTKEQWETFVHEFLVEDVVIGSVIYNIYVKYEKNLTYDYSEYVSWLAKKSSVPEEEKVQYQLYVLALFKGASIVFESLNVFKVKSTSENLIVTYISPMLKEAIKNNLNLESDHINNVNKFIEKYHSK